MRPVALTGVKLAAPAALRERARRQLAAKCVQGVTPGCVVTIIGG